jgi:hypothetical protein
MKMKIVLFYGVFLSLTTTLFASENNEQDLLKERLKIAAKQILKMYSDFNIIESLLRCLYNEAMILQRNYSKEKSKENKKLFFDSCNIFRDSGRRVSSELKYVIGNIDDIREDSVKNLEVEVILLQKTFEKCYQAHCYTNTVNSFLKFD